MFCVNCGKKIDNDAKYCSSCGAKLIGESNSLAVLAWLASTGLIPVNNPHIRKSGKMMIIVTIIALTGYGVIYTTTRLFTHTQTIMLPGEVPLEMVWIPSGAFLRGSLETEMEREDCEGPQHKVTVDGFWMGKYELTQAQWISVMGANPSSRLSETDSRIKKAGLSLYPVENVSWYDAHDFIEKLNQLTGKTFSLPSEAEWEYACRAGTTTRCYWGDDPCYAQLGMYAWTDYETHAVGVKNPNTWGLYDMIGNVSEWCEDVAHDSYTDAPLDGSAWVSGELLFCITRGGDSSEGYRSAARGSRIPESSRDDTGFRIIMR